MRGLTRIINVSRIKLYCKRPPFGKEVLVRLNADIVFDNLPAKLGARIDGPRNMDLTLLRPQLYEGNGAAFPANRITLLEANRLPSRVHAERGAVLVCLGNSSRLESYRNRCCVITIPMETDFYQLFNILQGIFDRYEAWDEDLMRIVRNEGDITHLLDRSEEIFGNSLHVIDESFRILGESSSSRNMLFGAEGDAASMASLALDKFNMFLDLHDISLDERDPIVLNLLDTTTLNQNIFDGDEYRGCVTVQYSNQPFRPSHKPLITHLARHLLQAIKQLSTLAPDSIGSLKLAVQGLVLERPLEMIERKILTDINKEKYFIFMRLKLSSRLEQLPLGYVRSMISSTFPHSIVFDYHQNSVVAAIDTCDLSSEDPVVSIAEGIAPFIGNMEMKAGLSEPSNNLLRSHALFKQADIALDFGALVDPSRNLYLFKDYALSEMVINAVNGMPLDVLCPAGLNTLIEHDKTSSASYLETLRVFLESNANMAKTASQLYLHRSTLAERLGRIRRELGLDLDDPDVQLMLRILLKAIEVRDKLRSPEDVSQL